ncbi:hypothetical protein SAMN05444338_1068 [Flavobacterium degerlachei]|uniref:Uncharacterized protein n=1 Tax=Flavobacterium degerlachei TaxID=229203 RepID=A0A1H2XTJ8_9FLAO|nr:hypothetical protein SAMN05444338_1068 [Flavobacterium degerlachei]
MLSKKYLQNYLNPTYYSSYRNKKRRDKIDKSTRNQLVIFYK